MALKPNIGSLVGTWTYRTFRIDPDLATAFNGLEFGAVNDAPTLGASADPPPIREDAATQTIGRTGISAGPSNESGQTLTVPAASSNPGLISNRRSATSAQRRRRTLLQGGGQPVRHARHPTPSWSRRATSPSAARVPTAR